MNEEIFKIIFINFAETLKRFEGLKNEGSQNPESLFLETPNFIILGISIYHTE